MATYICGGYCLYWLYRQSLSMSTCVFGGYCFIDYTDKVYQWLRMYLVVNFHISYTDNVYPLLRVYLVVIVYIS